MIEEHGRDAKLRGIEVREDMMRIIRAIVITDACMVTPDNEMRTSIVLAHERVENGFTRASIAHSSRQYAKNHAIRRIVVFQQDFVAAHAHVSRDIIALGITNQGMQEQAVNGLQGALLNVLMRSVYRVACLEAYNTFPTTLR